MERLLIVGASGLVGSRLAALAEGRYQVHRTFLSHPLAEPGSTRLDATDREAVFRLVDRVRPALVVDTHALNNVDYCETHHEEAWRSNVDGSRNVAEASKKVGATYTFLSTDYVFDGAKATYTEEDEPRPLNHFARTKVAVEQSLAAMDFGYVVARTSVVYGMGGANKTPFARWLIGKLRRREPVRIVHDQKNNPTFADNLAQQLLALHEGGETGIFHGTGRDCLSRYDFAREIAEVFDLDVGLIIPVTTAELGQAAPRPLTVNMSTVKIDRATGIPSLRVRDGLAGLKDQLGNDRRA